MKLRKVRVKVSNPPSNSMPELIVNSNTRTKNKKTSKYIKIKKTKTLPHSDAEVTFNDLTKIFHVGDEVCVLFEKEYLAGKLSSFEIDEGIFGKYFTFSIQCITANSSGRIATAGFRSYVMEWKGKRKIADCKLQILSPELKNKLTARGKIFKNVIFSPSYMYHTDAALVPHPFGWIPVPSNSRIMIDPKGSYLINPRFMSHFNDMFYEEDNTELTDISDDCLYMTHPFVPAFNFRTKQWVAAKVDKLISIEYNTDAYDKLVLDSTYKQIIKSLIENSDNTFSDIIDGKSGGFIFLLHGPPGSGKTLTAESVAETLRKPLYIMSVGELGVTPSDLEQNLTNILHLASRWKAILLLDEADIVLEQRQDHDLARNAMVAIFLRQLEYFDGILFLTTNRVKNFDTAFNSRISLALHYTTDSCTIRYKIWHNLLTVVKDDIYTGSSAWVIADYSSELSKFNLNGRQIKNCIRLAIALSKSENRLMNIDDLLKIINLSEKFIESY